ncbi:MAG: vWA domain-containing protein [Candidatus Helarchaeota archaeon]
MLKNIEHNVVNLTKEIETAIVDNSWDNAISGYIKLKKIFKDTNLILQSILTEVSIASLFENKGEIEKAANTITGAAKEFEAIKKNGYAYKAYQRALELYQYLNKKDQITQIEEQIDSLNMLDLVIITDSTGSMGPALDAIKKEIAKMLYLLAEKIPGVQVGALTYRDHCDENKSYLIKTHSFTEQSEYTSLINFVKKWTARGGGDIPEAVEDVLNYLQKGFEWETDNKVAILIADAPPHEKSECPKNLDWREETQKLANDEIKVYTILTDGNPEAEKIFSVISDITQAKFFNLSNIYDLPSLIVAIALDQVQLVEDFIIELEEKGELTESLKTLLKTFKG